MGPPAFVNRVHVGLKSLNCDGARGLALAGLCLAMLLPTLWGEPGRRLLRYDRPGLAEGQWWRLVSAHLVHLDVRHALLNCLGLVLMWVLFARQYSPGRWLAIVLGAMAAIDLGLWSLDSTVLWYVGSSGVLHGVMAAGVLAQLRGGEPEGWILGAFLAVKLGYEHWYGALPLSGSDPVVVNAHLYGVAGGTAVAAFLRPRAAPV